MRLGDISVAYVELMAKAVRSLGHKPEALLAQYQLDAVRLASPQARISIPRFMRLGHAMMQSYELPALGLLMVNTARRLFWAGGAVGAKCCHGSRRQ